MLTRSLLIGFALLAGVTGQAAVAPCAGDAEEDAQPHCLGQQAEAGGVAEAPLAAGELVQSTIVSISRRRGGGMIFRLANGQAWMQETPGFMLANPGEQVVIASARFGSDILTTERSAATRVQRVE